jgi:hypothetical protein
MANNPADDHHFLPVFYLKRWQRSDGLVEYARRGNGKIEGRPCFPKGTGYKPGLYSVQLQNDPVKAAELETKFMQVIDGEAAKSLELMETGSNTQWTPDRRTAWSRFIMSMLQRVPEEVELFKNTYAEFFNKVHAQDEERYKAIRWDGLPQTLAEFLDQRKIIAETGSLQTLQRLMDHDGLGLLINNMIWTSLHTPDAKHEFLTSDRPILMTATLKEENAYIIIPIGRRRLFVATNDRQTMDMIINKSQSDLVNGVNQFVVAHAVKYVYGSDGSQLRFVQNRMSSIKFEPLFSRLYKTMKRDMPRLA